MRRSKRCGCWKVRENLQLCKNQPIAGSSQDGGYTQMMLARSTGLVSDGLRLSERAALNRLPFSTTLTKSSGLESELAKRMRNTVTQMGMSDYCRTLIA